MTADQATFDRAEAAAAAIRRALGDPPDVAVILGSGLGGFAERLTGARSLPYGEIPDWPDAATPGHGRRLVVGACGGRRVLALAGRPHLYEGHAPERLGLPMRTLARMGVRVVIVTNAAGGIAPGLVAGRLMVIDDHINLTGTSPLTGPNDTRLGPRFPDMSDVYSPRLRALADEVAAAQGLSLAHGVYAGVAGPNYETPAEIRAFRALGADAVGMSTVADVIVARHMALEVLGLSCIANRAAGLGARRLDQDDVLEAATRAGESFAWLLEGIIARL